MTKLQEFQTSTCYKCFACAEQHLSNAENLDVRNSGAIKVWCHGVSDVQFMVMGECDIQKEMCE